MAPRTTDGQPRPGRSIVLTALGVLLASQPTKAQPTSRLGGFWIGGGLAVGFAGVSCRICRKDRDDALSASVRMGGTFGQSVLVGFEATGWRHRDEEFDFQLGALTGVAIFYPSSRAAGIWYIKTGAGAVAYRARDANGTPITTRSPAAQFEIGYTLDVHAGFGLAPYLNFVGSMGARLQQDGQVLTRAGVTLIQLGLGVTFF